MSYDPRREQTARDEQGRRLRRAALSSTSDGLLAWREWVGASDRWCHDPGSRWWLPLVWWNLRGAPIEEGDRRALREEYTQAWIRHQHAVARVGPLLAALHREGIRTLLLKGAALSLTAYDRPGLRPFGDIDVLVARDDADRARGVIEHRGWVPIRRLPPALMSVVPSLNYTDADGVDLDLHWSALAECTASGADRGFWERSLPLRFGGETTRALCPTDQLLQVCVHGLRFAWIRTDHWLADAAMVLRRAGAGFDWNACLLEARSRRLCWQLARALERIGEATPARVPPEVLGALGEERIAWWEPFELRAKEKTSHRSVVMQAWCGRTRARAMSQGDTSPASVTMRLQAVAGCESRWQLFSREALSLLWPRRTAHTFEAYGRRIRIDTDIEPRRVIAALHDRLPPLRPTRANALPDRIYEVLEMDPRPAPAPRYRALVNRGPLSATSTLDETADLLVSDLQSFLACASSDRTFLHAGVVAVGDRLVILPGASGSGKSTLVAALLRAGATYFSDEFALLDARGLVHPYSRPLRLRDSNGEETRVRPSSTGARTAQQGRPASLILFTSYVPQSELSFVPLSPGTALFQLLAHCPGAQARPTETLAVLRTLVTAAPAWATDRPDVDGVVAALVDGALSRSSSAAMALPRERQAHQGIVRQALL